MLLDKGEHSLGAPQGLLGGYLVVFSFNRRPGVRITWAHVMFVKRFHFRYRSAVSLGSQCSAGLIQQRRSTVAPWLLTGSIYEGLETLLGCLLAEEGAGAVPLRDKQYPGGYQIFGGLFEPVSGFRIHPAFTNSVPRS